MPKLLERSDFSSDESYEKYLHSMGVCPSCKRSVGACSPPFGSFAPEIWQSMRENGIDPGTNHSTNCTRRF